MANPFLEGLRYKANPEELGNTVPRTLILQKLANGIPLTAEEEAIIGPVDLKALTSVGGDAVSKNVLRDIPTPVNPLPKGPFADPAKVAALQILAESKGAAPATGKGFQTDYLELNQKALGPTEGGVFWEPPKAAPPVNPLAQLRADEQALIKAGTTKQHRYTPDAIRNLMDPSYERLAEQEARQKNLKPATLETSDYLNKYKEGMKSRPTDLAVSDREKALETVRALQGLKGGQRYSAVTSLGKAIEETDTRRRADLKTLQDAHDKNLSTELDLGGKDLASRNAKEIARYGFDKDQVSAFDSLTKSFIGLNKIDQELEVGDTNSRNQAKKFNADAANKREEQLATIRVSMAKLGIQERKLGEALASINVSNKTAYNLTTNPPPKEIFQQAVLLAAGKEMPDPNADYIKSLKTETGKKHAEDGLSVQQGLAKLYSDDGKVLVGP